MAVTVSRSSDWLYLLGGFCNSLLLLTGCSLAAGLSEDTCGKLSSSHLFGELSWDSLFSCCWAFSISVTLDVWSHIYDQKTGLTEIDNRPGFPLLLCSMDSLMAPAWSGGGLCRAAVCLLWGCALGGYGWGECLLLLSCQNRADLCGRQRKILVISLLGSATFPLFSFVCAVQIEWPQVPLLFQIPALTHDALPRVSPSGVALRAELWVLGKAHWPHSFRMVCGNYLPDSCSSAHSCSSCLFTASLELPRGLLGRSLSPLILWAGASSAQFLSLIPPAFCLKGFP